MFFIFIFDFVIVIDIVIIFIVYRKLYYLCDIFFFIKFVIMIKEILIDFIFF